MSYKPIRGGFVNDISQYRSQPYYDKQQRYNMYQEHQHKNNIINQYPKINGNNNTDLNDINYLNNNQRRRHPLERRGSINNKNNNINGNDTEQKSQYSNIVIESWNLIKGFGKYITNKISSSTKNNNNNNNNDISGSNDINGGNSFINRNNVGNSNNNNINGINDNQSINSIHTIKSKNDDVKSDLTSISNIIPNNNNSFETIKSVNSVNTKIDFEKKETGIITPIVKQLQQNNKNNDGTQVEINSPSAMHKIDNILSKTHLTPLEANYLKTKISERTSFSIGTQPIYPINFGMYYSYKKYIRARMY